MVKHLSLLLDPLGRSAPDLPSKEELVKIETNLNDAATMICNAQASPVPTSK